MTLPVARTAIARAEARPALTGEVVAVACDAGHNFTKSNVAAIELLPGLGVKGDAHLGVTVQHRARVRDDPTKPNLRQVHLIHAELFAQMAAQGFRIGAGTIGENITTRGLDLLALPKAARLAIGEALVEITGLRTPCRQIEAFQPGLLAALCPQDERGEPAFQSGIMGIVLKGGVVRAGDTIAVELPPEPHLRLKKV